MYKEYKIKDIHDILDQTLVIEFKDEDGKGLFKRQKEKVFIYPFRYLG